MIKDDISNVVRVLRGNGAYPETVEILSFPDATTMVGRGRKCVNFASNDYLAHSKDPKVIAATVDAVKKFGLGACGSRMTSGTQVLHRRLEKRIAQFKGTEDAVAFSAGFLANLGLMPALMGLTLYGYTKVIDPSYKGFASCEIFVDKLSHASILDGLAVATSPMFHGTKNFKFYAHVDMAELEQMLRDSEAQNKLIITDGVFSLHGHLAPVDKIVALARQYGAEVYLDDAHGSGLFGANGRGTAELFGVDDQIDFPMGTFSKALGGEGGYIAASKEACDYYRFACRTALYQAAMAPGMAAGLIASLDLVRDEPQRRRDLFMKAQRMRSEIQLLGFDILGSVTQIIPVRFWERTKVIRAAEMLFNEGVFAPAYYFPAVRKDEDMIRVNIMSAHTDSQLDLLLSALEKAGRATGVI